MLLPLLEPMHDVGCQRAAVGCHVHACVDMSIAAMAFGSSH